MNTRSLICFAILFSHFLVGPSVQAQTESTRPAIRGLAFVRIGVRNMDSARQFYNGELRLPLLKSGCVGPEAECLFVNPDQQIDLIKTGTSPRGNFIDLIGMWTSDATALRVYLETRGLKPGQITTDSQGVRSIQLRDPEGHLIQFLQRTGGFAGSMSGIPPISKHMIHAGFIVKDRAAMDKFYRDILGFHLYWQGGMKDGETNWVSMQVPDGTDWIEYMLNVDPKADQRLRGVMNHIALGVPSVKEAAIQLEKNGVKLTEQPKIGRDGKWQLNLYDPDLTRVELMEFTPVEKPCCSEFTGTHPKP